MKILIKRIVAVIFVLLIISSCQDDFDSWGYVNFFIEPDATEYYNLNDGARGWEYFEGGNQGIIIVRNSHNEFMAYERSCTEKKCKGRLKVESDNNVLIHCTKCSGRWLTVDGSPLENSGAKRMLYSYCQYFDGWRLYVRNYGN